jgi:hypothetical protein
VRISTYGSGTVTVILLKRQDVSENPSVVFSNTTLAVTGSTASLGTILVCVKSAASTNATLEKSTAGNLYHAQPFNNTAAAKYVTSYNLTTTPTVGTSTPAFTIIVPANGTVVVDQTIPIGFATGISYCITGAVTDADTTAVAVDDVHGLIVYS